MQEITQSRPTTWTRLAGVWENLILKLRRNTASEVLEALERKGTTWQRVKNKFASNDTKLHIIRYHDCGYGDVKICQCLSKDQLMAAYSRLKDCIDEKANP